MLSSFFLFQFTPLCELRLDPVELVLQSVKAPFIRVDRCIVVCHLSDGDFAIFGNSEVSIQRQIDDQGATLKSWYCNLWVIHWLAGRDRVKVMRDHVGVGPTLLNLRSHHRIPDAKTVPRFGLIN